MSRRNMLPELVIDPEFESYVPPLTQEEFDLLEENILCMHRVTDPIIVWNRNVIVDGHNRYRIIQKHPELFFTTENLDVDTREEVLDWICRIQLGRRNLTPEQKKFLIGKQYENEKHAHGGDRRSEEARSTGQNDQLKTGETVRARIARERGTSDSYVKRAELFARGLDIMDEIVPGLRNEVLNGKRKIPETGITAIVKANPSDRRELINAILNGQSAAAILRKKKEEERKAYRDSIKRIEAISAEMEKPKDTTREPWSILYEMNDALESLIFRWNFALNNPHKDFTEDDINALKKLFSEGLDYIHGLENSWEGGHVGSSH